MKNRRYSMVHNKTLIYLNNALVFHGDNNLASTWVIESGHTREALKLFKIGYDCIMTEEIYQYITKGALANQYQELFLNCLITAEFDVIRNVYDAYNEIKCKHNESDLKHYIQNYTLVYIDTNLVFEGDTTEATNWMKDSDYLLNNAKVKKFVVFNIGKNIQMDIDTLEAITIDTVSEQYQELFLKCLKAGDIHTIRKICEIYDKIL